MAIQFDDIAQLNGTEDVPLNSEIVFRVYDDGATPLDLLSLDVTVDKGAGAAAAITSGVFVNDWTGEIIDNSAGNNDDLTVVLINPISSPEFPQGQLVDVSVTVTI